MREVSRELKSFYMKRKIVGIKKDFDKNDARDDIFASVKNYIAVCRQK
jgi:hypothetical protein